MPGQNCLHEVFAAKVREAPDRIAVTAADRQITYGELDARAGRLARQLRALGVGPERLVGLCAERGIEMIVGLVAILEAGGAYLPIDPAYPLRRIQLLLADSAASLVVSTSRAARSLEGCGATVVLMDGLLDGLTDGAASGAPGATEDNLAYAIYTSGSTGTPKGTLIEHRQAVRLFGETRATFGFDERDVWTQFHSISFDFSVWEIWGALLHGGRLVIVSAEAARSPVELNALLVEEGVTVLCQTPSAFQQLMAQGESPAAGESPAGLPLRLVVFGGERLEPKMLAPWIACHGDQRPALINGYGITETTVFTTFRRMLAADLEQPEVSPIGTPIADLETPLLDAAGRAVPDGTPGEIHVAGPALARGYLNRPDLTAERFVPAPGGARLYRSGDLAVRLPDGDLAYLGRADDQVKVRGFRVEPREIEACLLGHPGVAAAVVVPQDYGDGDLRLTACIVPRPGLSEGAEGGLPAALAEKAAAELPAHLRPSAYRALSELPLTAQGKVDREALRQLTAPASPAPGPAEPAGLGTAATEQAILDIVEEVLQRRGIAVHDDLFDAGGTSMAIIRILRAINQRFDVALTGAELGDEASVARLAQCVDAARPAAGPAATEQAIQQIVEDVLQRRGIGPRDDLFDLGGTSMALIRILRTINQRFDVSLTGSELGDEASIARLAECVDTLRTPHLELSEPTHAGIPTAS